MTTGPSLRRQTRAAQQTLRRSLRPADASGADVEPTVCRQSTPQRPTKPPSPLRGAGSGPLFVGVLTGGASLWRPNNTPQPASSLARMSGDIFRDPFWTLVLARGIRANVTVPHVPT